MSFSFFLVNEAGGVDIMGIVDIVDTVGTVDNVKSVDSVDNVNSVNSVNRFNRCNRCKKHKKLENGHETDKILTKSDENRAIGIAPSRGTFLEGSRTQQNSKKVTFWDLSEDPGPHAVFFSCVRRAGRGGGISRMVVVVVVD